MAKFIHDYVTGCALCQQMKINTHPTSPPGHPIEPTATLPFRNINVDFITELPPCQEKTAMLVVVDHDSSDGGIFIPCTKNEDAITTAQLLHEHVFRRFGLWDSMISDRGPQFASQVTQELHKKLGIKSRMSTAYRPQTDGKAERTMQHVESYLRMFCADHPDTWVDTVPDMEFAFNQRVPQGKSESLFFIIMGYNPRAIPTVSAASDLPAVTSRLEKLQTARDEALATHQLAQQRMAERSTSEFTPFKLGQKVWLEATNLRNMPGNRKLQSKREGPFPITEVLGPLTYRLQLPKHWRKHPVFHASQLSPFRETHAHGPAYAQPPPDIIHDAEEYEVEAILPA